MKKVFLKPEIPVPIFHFSCRNLVEDQTDFEGIFMVEINQGDLYKSVVVNIFCFITAFNTSILLKKLIRTYLRIVS